MMVSVTSVCSYHTDKCTSYVLNSPCVYICKYRCVCAHASVSPFPLSVYYFLMYVWESTGGDGLNEVGRCLGARSYWVGPSGALCVSVGLWEKRGGSETWRDLAVGWYEGAVAVHIIYGDITTLVVRESFETCCCKNMHLQGSGTWGTHEHISPPEG